MTVSQAWWATEVGSGLGRWFHVDVRETFVTRLCHFVSLRPSPSTCRCSHSLWLSADLSERNQMRRHFLETTSAKAHETKLRIKLKSLNSSDMVKDLWTCNMYVTAFVIYPGRIIDCDKHIPCTYGTCSEQNHGR